MEKDNVEKVELTKTGKPKITKEEQEARKALEAKVRHDNKLDKEVFSKLTKALDQASKIATPKEARFLVDNYYILQRNRIRAFNQIWELHRNGEPHQVMDWVYANALGLEMQVQRALDRFSMGSELGRWCRSICGIGPVLASAMLAYHDPKRPYAGNLFRFVGLDPTCIWMSKEKVETKVNEVLGDENLDEVHVGKLCKIFGRNFQTILKATLHDGKFHKDDLIKALCKRPWNATMKTVVWKIGESFMKVSSNDRDYYGKLYLQRRAYETEKNERGDYAVQARSLAARFKDKSSENYKLYMSGKLGKGHIVARSKRWAAKCFVSHFFDVGFWLHNQAMPPKPWIVALGGHTQYVPPPNFDTTTFLVMEKTVKQVNEEDPTQVDPIHVEPELANDTPVADGDLESEACKTVAPGPDEDDAAADAG